MAQHFLAYGLFVREDSLNVPRMSELYFLYSMLEGDPIDLGSFLVNQLRSVATSSIHNIVNGAFITPIAGLVVVEPNPDDIVTCSKRLNLAAFEHMKFCK